MCGLNCESSLDAWPKPSKQIIHVELECYLYFRACRIISNLFVRTEVLDASCKFAGKKPNSEKKSIFTKVINTLRKNCRFGIALIAGKTCW